MARDPKFARIVARGEQQTGASRDFTVKVDVGGLEPGTTYYYRFEAAKAQSAIGRTRTLPARGVSRIRLGVASCSNYPFGYFNAYAALARRLDLDAVLHLGDYIYEYANGGFGDGTAIGRIPQPNAEIVALADYRARHAQHKADPDSQAVHRQHPFIVIWDDHEFANNSWSGGAAGHNPDKGEGDWLARRNAAIQAYFEWMPIREDRQALSPLIYRTLKFGDLADLVMLDTRLVGRDLQAASRDDVASIESPARSLLGPAQDAWLRGELAESKRNGARWQLIGQQVMFAPQSRPGQPTSNADSWDGYRAARDRVFDMIEEHKLDSVAVLDGRRAQLVGLRPAAASLRQLRFGHRSRFAGRRIRRHVGDLEQQPRRWSQRRAAAARHQEGPPTPPLRGWPLSRLLRRRSHSRATAGGLLRDEDDPRSDP